MNNQPTNETQPSQKRVTVKRLNFFCRDAFPEYKEATAYRFAVAIGQEKWGRMAPMGRKFLRNCMRNAALRAVAAAKIDAQMEAAS